MTTISINPRHLSRLLDFFVPVIAFWGSCMLLTPGDDRLLLLQAVVYASVITVALRCGRGLLSRASGSAGRVMRLLLGNALGIGMGVIVLSAVSLLLPQFFTMASLIVASILAFFVLGTLSPLLEQNKRAPMRRSVA